MKGWFEYVRETCPICDKSGACIRNAEGDKVACIRVPSDIPFSKSSTCPSWLHKVDKESNQKVEMKNVEQFQSETKRSTKELDRLYRAIMDCTDLAQHHYEHLVSDKRQLSDKQIFAREYRSFPQKPWNIVKDIKTMIDEDDFTGVPGFYLANGRYGSYWNIAASHGILLPFRNQYNQITGYQIRVDNPPNEVEINKRKPELKARVKEQPNLVQVLNEDEILFDTELQLGESIEVSVDNTLNGMLGWVKLKKGNRYFWLSSAKKNKGTSSGEPAPVHVSIPSDELREWKIGQLKKAKTVWLSEGPLKCDIAVDKIKELYSKEELEEVGTTMLALPGVGAWELALPLLKDMEVEKVNICFDADAMSNPLVKGHLMNCAKELKKLGYQANLILWSRQDANGIDDLFLTNKVPNIQKLF